MTLAAGDVKSGTSNAKRHICIFTGLAATNGQPSGATAGVPCYMSHANRSADTGACYNTNAAREATLVVKGTGTGTVTGTFRLWGYMTAATEWFPLGTGADSTKGIINGGAAIGEVKSDKVLHAEPVLMAGHFDRLYLECTAIGGSSPSFEAWLVTPRTVSY
jgi:hypothetical protein